MAGRRQALSPHCFAERCCVCSFCLVDGALASDEADETEDEREVRDESETIDSGEEAGEMVLASDERRPPAWYEGSGGELPEPGQRSSAWAALMLDIWAMAKPMDEGLPRRCGTAVTAGVLKALDCGGSRGVGSRTRDGDKKTEEKDAERVGVFLFV